MILLYIILCRFTWQTVRTLPTYGMTLGAGTKKSIFLYGGRVICCTFQTPCVWYDSGMCTNASWTSVPRKVVTRSLPRFLLVHATSRHVRTKSLSKSSWHMNLRADTRNEPRSPEKRAFLDSSHDQCGERERFTDPCAVVSKSSLWKHVLLFKSWPSRCPSCLSSPPSFRRITFPLPKELELFMSCAGEWNT